jgi:hypothetical protein
LVDVSQDRRPVDQRAERPSIRRWDWTLFCGPFQAAECVGGPGDEPPAKGHFQEVAPPTWREAERSIKRCATRAGVDECDLNLLAVLDAKRQRNVEGELPEGLQVNHVEGYAEDAGSKDKLIASADRSRRRFDQSRP